MVVTALIDEKARLNDEKVQLRKNCRDEKAKLEQELERMRKRREDMEKEEAAEVLRQIDSEFDHEHHKLLEQRKQIADVNRVSPLCSCLLDDHGAAEEDRELPLED